MTEQFRPHRALERLYPEVTAGGFTRHDGFVEFFMRVNSLMPDGADVLDFGAGRGSWTDAPLAPVHRQLRDLGQRAGKVIGIDVDPVVLDNPTLDEAHLMQPGDDLPFADASFDLVVADHVIEHVKHRDAEGVAREVGRVLKPGGWFAARTPNKWGMIGVTARIVPNKLHVQVLKRLQPGRRAEDVFPTQYAMNTRRDLRRLFPEPEWTLAAYTHASEPQYVGRSVPAWRMASFVDRLTPSPLLPTLMVFARKN